MTQQIDAVRRLAVGSKWWSSRMTRLACHRSQAALEILRREAERVAGILSVYSGEIAQGQDRMVYPLPHRRLPCGEPSPKPPITQRTVTLSVGAYSINR
ncbi:MAG: hypothetical protein L0387_15960 [Acidobacteria bacterium]|nr:hypothetical protein [Acidobacteriota bacterium]